MPLRQDLLDPITGDNPSGADLRRELYGEIREARRQDDGLPQGDWQRERKVADFELVSRVAQENLATRTKDLQLAAWLTEALLHLEGFSGLHQGLQVCAELILTFWDTLYPAAEDGDVEARANLLEWLANSLDIPLKETPLVKAGYGFLKFKESRLVGYEEQAQTEKEKETRAKLVEENKLTPDAFDKAFAETPKAFYAQAERELLACVSDVKTLDGLCDEKLGREAPSFNRLRTTLEEIYHTVHALLQKKRETEPDPVSETPAAAAGTSPELVGAGPDVGLSVAAVPSIVIPLASSESPDRKDAIAKIAHAAAYLRKREPHGPGPYLMLRGLRWGELRAVPDLSNARLLEAPSTELRQHIKRLALDKKWTELLEAAENAMSLPCSRAWLDLQRLVVMACTALGDDYAPIAAAIQSELRNLLHDIPGILDASLLDDTPAANAETRAWLQELMQAPAATASVEASELDSAAPGDSSAATPSWMGRASDPFALAQQAVRGGNPQKGLQIMQSEIARQRSGRGRFLRTLQLVQLCVEAGNGAIAQPLIDDVAAAIDSHKLDDWEDSETVAAALDTVLKVSKKMQENAEASQKLFERICRLDPARVLRTG
jgi:type VI secretion system protein ImpA